MTANSPKPAHRLVYAAASVLVVVSMLLRFRIPGAIVWSNWVFLCPALQLLVVVPTVAVYRKSRSVWVHALIATGLIGLTALTMFFACFDLVFLFIADVVVHVVFPIGWLVVFAGCLAAPMLLRRRLFLPLRFWVLAASTLLTAEVAARFLEPAPDFVDDIMPSLPGDLPDPPPGEIHVAAIGGSSTEGHPYDPKFGFAQVTAWRLQQLYPNRKVVLHNLAQGGANLRQAAHNLNRLDVRPHLLLIYTGHNEFYHDLEEFWQPTPSRLMIVDPWVDWLAMFRMSNRWISRRRSYREIRTGERFLFDRPIATPSIYRNRVERFRNQCRQLSAYCRRRRIRPIWFIPAASEAGFEPNRSGNRMHLTSAELTELDEIERAARAMNCESAVELYRRVVSRYPDSAEFHFRLGECLRKIGSSQEAQKHFAEAINRDGHPIRANRDYRLAIRETARTSHDPLVETMKFLRAHSDDQILGATLFHDNVHMTLKGYYLTGLAGCKTIVESEAISAEFGPPKVVAPLTLASAIEKATLNREDLANAYRKTAFGYRELQQWRWDRVSRQQQSRRYQRLADALRSGEIEPGQDGAESLTPK